MFINQRLYTDIHSYKVLSINGKKATIVEVKKNPLPLEFIPGGFIGTVVNQSEAYHNSTDIEEIGTPFEVELRNGVWGRWVKDCQVIYGITEEGVKRQMEHSKKMGDKCQYRLEEDGTYTIIISFLTKTGKEKRYFHKIGVMEEECHYFYDHNF